MTPTMQRAHGAVGSHAASGSRWGFVGALATAALVCGLGWTFEPVAAHAQSGALAVQELAPGVRLEILELKRVTGGLVHLSFALVNETDADVDPQTWGITPGRDPYTLTYCACGIALLDLQNLKRHGAGNSTTARSLAVPAQSRREFWAQFAEPPADVSAMTIEVPVSGLIYDVPIGS